MPKVSIIIPTYNRAGTIVRALESVLDQTFTNYEVIVIDDGSTDNTRLALAPYLSKIKYIYQDNRGVSSARNRGIRESKEELIAFLDSDDVWLPRKLEKQVEFLVSNRKVFILACLAEGDTIDPKHLKMRKAQNQFLIFLETPFPENVSRYLVRKECFEKCGLFDPSLPRSEDWELWLRFIKKGFRFDFVEEPLVRYGISPASLSKNLVTLLQGNLHIKQKHVDSISNPLKRLWIGSKFLARTYSILSWNYGLSGDRKKGYVYILKSLILNPIGPRTIDRIKFLLFLILSNLHLVQLFISLHLMRGTDLFPKRTEEAPKKP